MSQTRTAAHVRPGNIFVAIFYNIMQTFGFLSPFYCAKFSTCTIKVTFRKSGGILVVEGRER